MTASLIIILIFIFIPLGLLAMCWWLWLFFALLAALPTSPRAAFASTGESGRGVMIDILIPAHDEEILLPALLQSLQNQSALGKFRLRTILVIADHCTDQTAQLARDHGAEVLERHTGPRGKPAALRDGIVHLATLSPCPPVTPRAIAIIDADCTASANLVEEFAAALDAGHQVAQATNLVDQPNEEYSLSTIAFALKNLIRPRGMARLGIPTQLFGTGMCFHTSLLATAGGGGPIRFSDHLTEDLAVSHDLLLQKIPPVFLAAASVRSPIPADNKSMSTQKIRWETGQLHTWKKLPLLLFKLIARGQFRSALALLDWSAPPVAMAVLAWFAVTVLAAVCVIFHLAPWQLLLAPAAVLSLLVLYIIVGTLQLAGPAALLRLVLAIPKFFLWKLTLYARMATGQGAKGWQKSRAAPSTVQPAPPEVHP